MNKPLLGNLSFTKGVRRFLYAVTPKEASFAKLDDVPDYLNEAVPFFFGAIALEYILAFLTRLPPARLNDAFSSIAAGTLSQLSKIIILSAELALYVFIYDNFNLITLPWDYPGTWYFCFIGVDFIYYWFHRAAHEINIMWAAHQVHHSSEDYNFTTALRQSVVQNYTSAIFYMPLALVVPPSIFFVHSQFNMLYQFWIHTEIVRSLGPLEYILNTPSHHRVHHGRNPYCIDKNYGGTLIIWDRIFGTFQAETDEEIAYGLVHPLASWDPIWTQLCHFCHIWKTFWETPGLKDKLAVLFKGPGWTPGKPRLGDPADLPEIEYPIQRYDSSLSYWGNVYVLVHFAVTIVAYQLLIARRMLMNQLHVLGVISYFLFTISSVGALFDNKWYAPYMELFRCLLFLIVDLVLSSQNLDTGVLPTAYIGVIRGIFIASAFLWIIGSLVSKSKLKIQ
ncbi:alkylglycerol monooxygenase-like [Pocillopora verrucosa]|uniref:alkylglycerol monooxygenase-like n=1 Tax=Pocillopora verrucosa TaxID=203993 RepID=UPI003340E48B